MSDNEIPLEADRETAAQLTGEDRRKLVDEAIERSDRIVEGEIEMARLFIMNGKLDFAQRRLRDVIERFPGSIGAEQAREILTGL